MGKTPGPHGWQDPPGEYCVEPSYHFHMHHLARPRIQGGMFSSSAPFKLPP